jgi:hypothetical protein
MVDSKRFGINPGVREFEVPRQSIFDLEKERLGKQGNQIHHVLSDDEDGSGGRFLTRISHAP